MDELSVASGVQKVLEQMRRVVVGKDRVLMWVMAAILAKGHILLEDLPGVGKTTMAVAFSKSLQLKYNRMQFTPDVLPSDVTGYSVLDPKDGSLTYREGSVLCNLFLADELNRATSRTQSALLEAMEEEQVTVDGKTYPLPEPFIVIATQNPAGAAGTQLLPDSQLDRFAVRLTLGYPAPKDELTMVLQRQGKDPLREVEPVVDAQTLIRMQEEVAQTFVSQEIAKYVVELMDATRRSPLLVRGASPRATLAVVSMAKAVARLQGRDYVVPKDVQEVWSSTVAHRLHPSVQAEGEGKNVSQVLEELLTQVQPPKIG